MDIYDVNGSKYTPTETVATVKKTIRILFIGNSLTQDGVAYLPYILKNQYGSDIDFKFYMWYKGGYTLAQQYSLFASNGKAEIFSVAENSESWTNYNNSKTMSWVLSTYTFDIVCLQEYFNYKESYNNLTDVNNVKDYIIANYTKNPLEFITLFHAPKRSVADSVFELTKTGNALILSEGVADDMIPAGIAVYRALSDITLNALGDQGGLSPDGTHTQEGLPCLLQTWTILLWLLNRLGMPTAIYGNTFTITQAIYNAINVPGANLGSGVITGSTYQNILAQEYAINAYKEGKQFVIENLHKELTV